jgi:hypothetical protein
MVAPGAALLWQRASPTKMGGTRGELLLPETSMGGTRGGGAGVWGKCYSSPRRVVHSGALPGREPIRRLTE